MLNVVQAITLYDKIYKTVSDTKDIEDITRRCEDMNFIFEWLKQYFTNERSE